MANVTEILTASPHQENQLSDSWWNSNTETSVGQHSMLDPCIF